MASGLYNLQASISRNLIRCLKHSSDISTSHKSRWRSVTSLSFIPGLVDDIYPVEDSKCRPAKKTKIALHDLKEKEKEDWRNLTLEEKQALYRMSFSQPFCDIVDQPADEWKLILASTFTAMGLMTLGMYIWLSQGHSESDIGPLSNKNELKDKIESNLYYGKGMATVV